MLGIATCLGVGLISVLTDPKPSGDSDLHRQLRLHLVVAVWLVAKETAICQVLAQFVIGALLLVSGDVEVNPGPVTALSLTEGLAKVAAAAPAGPVKNIILTWSPDKDVKSDMDKQYKVPELRQALAWLRNCNTDNSYLKSLKRKTEVLDALLVAIERLLPDQCGVCKNEYTVDRESSPAIQCSGCQQGFHQECLEALVGNSVMPEFPGQIYWLCELCAPSFSLMTSLGADGKTEKPRSKRVVADPTLPPTTTSSPETETEETVNPQLSGHTEARLVPPPQADCPKLLRNECPHGMSGKKNGVCQYLHRARCSRYMKWGDKVDKGCHKVPCEKLHPLVCPRSLDLKCLASNCDVKLHTRKCQRPSHTKGGGGGDNRHDRTRGGGGSHIRGGVGVQREGGRHTAHHQPRGPRMERDNSGGKGQTTVNWPHFFAGCQHGQCGQNHVPASSVPTGGAAGIPAGGGPWLDSPCPGRAPIQQPSFQMRCTPPDPAVHQLLDAWAGTMQKELQKQTAITMNMLSDKVKEVVMHLGGQGVIRPSC